MHRTQIYLPEPLHRTLRQHARLRGVTISHLIRENLEAKLLRNKVSRNKSVFEAVIEAGKKIDWSKAPRDLSDPKKIDEYVYRK